MLTLLRNARDFAKHRSVSELIGKGVRLVKREGIAGLTRLYLDLTSMDIGYEEWIRRYDTLTEYDRLLIRRHISGFSWQPLISILMPVYNPPAEFLRLAIASARRQLYPNWELCIADDASTQPHVRAILEQAVRADARIRVTFRARNGHISAASNTALDMARGEFLALLDHDDELSEHALYHVAAALSDDPELDLLYSDEDKIDAKGRRFGHYFKSDWNPDLFLAQNLISHLGVYRRRLALEIGGFREGFEGSQDWDFALRFVGAIPTDHVHHVPHILYHWRAIAGSTAVRIEAKQYAATAGQRALEEYWLRQGCRAVVEPVAAGHFLTRRPLPQPPPAVTIIVCTRDRPDLLRQCVKGIIEQTDYPRTELLIIDNGSSQEDALAYLESLWQSGIARVIGMPGPCNFAALNNSAVRLAAGAIVCLLNNDVVPKRPDWLKEMTAHALRTEIGAVGAKLLYPDGRIQHAGVFLDGIAAGHLHLAYPASAAGYGNRANLPQNVTAVTAACLVIRRTVWDEVGGMDESFAVAFNHVDFCLRVRARGYRNLWLPQAELYHHESASRGRDGTLEKRKRFQKEIASLQERWGGLLHADPYWNPNLALNGERIGLAAPPRNGKPWLTQNA